MVKHRFKIGEYLIIEIKAKSVQAAWFKLGQRYSSSLAEYGYCFYIGVKPASTEEFNG